MRKITLDLVSPDGTSWGKSKFPDDMLSEEIVAELVEQLGLQVLTDEGKRIEYRLRVKNKNTDLLKGKALRDHQIVDNDILQMVSSAQMPAKPPKPIIEPQKGDAVEIILSVDELHGTGKPAKFPLDMTIGEAIREIVRTHQLEVRDPDFKQLIVYRLSSKAHKRELNNEETFRSARIPNFDRLDLVRDYKAGSTNMLGSAKHNKLRIEYENLLKLKDRSRGRIEVEPIIIQSGRPPEAYTITFRCKGIVNISDSKAPIYGDEHKVSMYLSYGYPLREPQLEWASPIWHPNIDHEPPHHVCTNEIQSWWSGRHLDQLVLWLGELVQYKRYHAEWVPPFPLDPVVAEWVRDYAEPKRIVAPDKPVDETPLVPGWSIERDLRRIELGRPSAKEDRDGAGQSDPPPPDGPRKSKGSFKIELGVPGNNKG